MLDVFKQAVPVGVKRALRGMLHAREFPLPAEPRALVFLAADYGNIGDLAIAAAQLKFLSRTLPDHSVVGVPISATFDVMRSIRRQIGPRDLVTIVGGGNMGSLYPDIEQLRQRVIRSFPDNRIVCFPQSLDWQDTAASRLAQERIVKVYAGHRDVHVFAREAVSRDRLEQLFSRHSHVRIRYAPDIVLSASAADLGAAIADEGAPEGILLCLRDDCEGLLGAEHRRELHAELARTGLPVSLTDTHAGGVALDERRRASLLAGKIAQFASARLVVTDRLHGMILAATAGTPCLVLPNSNHKIRQSWQDWLRDQRHVRYLALDAFPTLGNLLGELLATPRREPGSPMVKPGFYADLTKAVTGA